MREKAGDAPNATTEGGKHMDEIIKEF